MLHTRLVRSPPPSTITRTTRKKYQNGRLQATVEWWINLIVSREHVKCFEGSSFFRYIPSDTSQVQRKHIPIIKRANLLMVHVPHCRQTVAWERQGSRQRLRARKRRIRNKEITTCTRAGHKKGKTKMSILYSELELMHDEWHVCVWVCMCDCREGDKVCVFGSIFAETKMNSGCPSHTWTQ